MITSDKKRIKQYTEQGLWTNDILHELLASLSQQHPDMLAVKDQPNRESLTDLPTLEFSYAQLDNASTNLACDLLNQGIKQDDIIIVQLPNVVELFTSYLAISKIGAIASPVPIQYGEHELKFVQQKTLAKSVISLARFDKLALQEKVSNALPGCQLLIFSDSGLQVDAEKNAANSKQLADYQKQYPADANHIFTVCWTSGTTGKPKGVPRSHNMWSAIAMASAEAGDYQFGYRLINPFPMVNMASISPNLFAPLLVGCSVYLHHPMDVPVFLKQIESEKINFALAPPLLLNQLAHSEEIWKQFDFSALKGVGSGSTPLAPWMIEKFEQDYKVDVVNYYGSNEGISLLSTKVTVADPAIRASMFPRFGNKASHWDLKADKLINTKIIDTDTAEEITEPNKAGELMISGPTVIDCYFSLDDEPEDTAVVSEDGYFHTGDLLEICGEPPLYYQIVGRCKDMINRGGMKISPAEIDVLLEDFEQIEEAAVCSYPDTDMGEKICACLVAKQGYAPDVKAVVEYLSKHKIAKFKLPERVELFDKLPRNPVGKVQRFLLQEAVQKRIESDK